MSITSEGYHFISRLLEEKSGLDLGPDKQYLLESRLDPLSASLKLPGIMGLVNHLRGNPDPAIVKAIVEAMTTNESLFFRDDTPFAILKNDILPHLFKTRSHTRTIRIWSAACSTGQEPYSIAMVLLQMPEFQQEWTVDIVATDLAENIVAKAKRGFFTPFEVGRGMPPHLLHRFFNQAADGWQVKEEVKKMVAFRTLNLIEPLPYLGVFDIVFCRNVLIYFSTDTKRKVLGQIASAMAKDGLLFVGGTETLLGVTDQFQKWSEHGGAIYTLAHG